MPGKNVDCVDIVLRPTSVCNGSPAVAAKIPPIVQVVEGIEYPPFNCELSVPEKSSFSSASAVNLGMTFSSLAPPFA